MEKVKSAERAAIIKSRPSPNEQKAVAANAGSPGLNSDGAPALRLRPLQLYHTQHGQQTVATGPLASDRKVHTTTTTTTTVVTQQQQQQDRVEHEKVNDKGGRNDRSEERVVEEQEDEEQENQYFYEDEIFCLTPKNGHVKFGLVLDNYDESDEETTEEDAPKRGEIRACWHPDGREEIIKQRKVSQSLPVAFRWWSTLVVKCVDYVISRRLFQRLLTFEFFFLSSHFCFVPALV